MSSPINSWGHHLGSVLAPRQNDHPKNLYHGLLGSGDPSKKKGRYHDDGMALVIVGTRLRVSETLSFIFLSLLDVTLSSSLVSIPEPRWTVLVPSGPS